MITVKLAIAFYKYVSVKFVVVGQPSDCPMRIVLSTRARQTSTFDIYINLRSVCVFVCVTQLFSVPSRPTLASEEPNESS